MAHNSLLDVIGGTPSVWLDRMVQARGLEGLILAKLDYLNPGFSKKDRAAKGIIEAAEALGDLRPGQTVVELTSGNMGTGLAIVCGLKGYPFVAVMSRGNSVERARMMVALGAEVVLYDRPGGESREEVGRHHQEARGLTMIKPYDEPQVIAGQGTTGLEIAAQASAAGVEEADVLVCCGGGSLTSGIALALEAEAPDTVRFTRAIKDGVPYEDRVNVIEALWRVVLADGHRDHEESGLLRLVADLLGINDRDSNMARKRVEQTT